VAIKSSATRQTKQCEPLEATLARERSLLGLSIVDRSGKSAGIMLAYLDEQDFVAALHKAVYRAVRCLIGRNEPLCYNSICIEMICQRTFEMFENARNLIASLGEGICAAYPMTRLAKAVRQAAAERRREEKR
jgi:replicative DNA helicase